MRFTKLILNDIGVFGGCHEFDFPTTLDKPIVLYGGTNGAGKSTIFESIPLCLYGQNILNEKATKNQYHKKIQQLFHRYKDHPSKEASVSLELEYAQNGNIIQYKISRLWQNNAGKIEESLTLHKLSSTEKKYIQIDSTNDSQIQMMINQMIPQTVSDIFFFDGESIRDIAEGGDEHLYLKSSFDSLLGLNISDKLRDDIGLHILRNSNDADKAVVSELESLNTEKDDTANDLERLIEKRVFLNGDISRKKKALAEKEKQFFSMGGKHAKDIENLTHKKEEISKTITDIDNDIRTIIENDLPLMIIPDLIDHLKQNISSDEDNIKSDLSSDAARSILDHMINEFKPHLRSCDSKTAKDLIDNLNDIADAKIASLSNDASISFDFSLSDLAIMKQKINSIPANDILPTPHTNYTALTSQLTKIDAQLTASPKPDEQGSLYPNIREMTLELGELESQRLHLEALEAQKRSKISLLNNKIRKLLTTKKGTHRNSLGLDLAPKIQDVLTSYSIRLRKEKIALLESNILKGIKKCFHKSRLITQVSIDPQTYKITLYNNNDEIPRDTLSQGELQLYVTAIVYGLAKTSGRPLPFIVDTPLARLDVEHRDNLILNFYPEASHQTIIFSTNTEVVDTYYELIKPHVSQTHLISYDPKTDTSTVGKGYFKIKGELT